MDIYQRNILRLETTAQELTKKLRELSAMRLVAFVFSIFFIVLLANAELISLIIVFVPLAIVGFGWLISHYQKVAFRKHHINFLKEINEQEIRRLHNELSEFEDGKSFIHRDHPYVSDLDIFGPHSLFQLLNRTTTDSGKMLLADWLSAPAPKSTILQRQDAVVELSAKVDWRQNFQASGMHFRTSRSDYHQLLTWMKKPIRLLPRQGRYFLTCIPLSILSTAAALYFIISLFSTDVFSDAVAGILPLVVMVAVNSLVLRKTNPVAEEITQKIFDTTKIVKGYRALTREIEKEEFAAPRLVFLQSSLKRDHSLASREMERLIKVLAFLQHRGDKSENFAGNYFYPILNVLWFVDIYLVIAVEKWKRKNALHFESWASAISEIEALSSVAGFHYSNPTAGFPEINEEPYDVRFEVLGHPLIHPEKRVSNDFFLKGKGEIAMITGSNMAGKSTFLRTVGVNMALALMGAPCCAKSAQVSNMQLFTSMRTQDNLEEGISSFRAELRRVEQLLKLIESGKPVFFLLDEMFKGTNSEDRHKGGVSLIRQLSELNAFGIISTHDLELAHHAGNHMIVNNYHFYSEISDGEMSFNYRLTEGICKDFNASELMKNSGIKILSDFGKTP